MVTVSDQVKELFIYRNGFVLSQCLLLFPLQERLADFSLKEVGLDGVDHLTNERSRARLTLNRNLLLITFFSDASGRKSFNSASSSAAF
jgi:hypothetical protein